MRDSDNTPKSDLASALPAHRIYPKAPITEALVDLRVKYSSPMALDQLRKFGTVINSEYPYQGTREEFQGQFEFGAAEPRTTSSRSAVGFIFSSRDRQQAVQARLDGFTFSRFVPYQHWNHLIREARRLWNIFVDVLMTCPPLLVQG
jgi:uncharacterized protein (TIGR04255 family)